MTAATSTIHTEPHPLAGKTVQIDITDIGTGEFRIEDWYDRVTGGSWMFAQGHPGALKYAIRSVFASLPTDNEVVYGKFGAFGNLVHVSELPES